MTIDESIVEMVRCPREPSLQKGKGSPYSIAERRVPELIPVLGSQPTGVRES